jgi:bacterioferritin
MTPQIDLKEQVLMALDESLKAELTAVHQYLLHAKLCHNWGYERLAELNRKEALDEFGHAEILIDRILFLKGSPNMTDLFPITAGSNVKEQLESSLQLEVDAVERLNVAVKIATDAGDNVSRQLFEKILIDEDHHIDYLEGQLHIVEEIGVERYLVGQIKG